MGPVQMLTAVVVTAAVAALVVGVVRLTQGSQAEEPHARPSGAEDLSPEAAQRRAGDLLIALLDGMDPQHAIDAWPRHGSLPSIAPWVEFVWIRRDSPPGMMEGFEAQYRQEAARLQAAEWGAQDSPMGLDADGVAASEACPLFSPGGPFRLPRR